MSVKITNTSISNGVINPPLVLDQLALMYDVGNRNSYTSGTTLTNMAPAEFSNGVNGTLDNSSMVVTPSNAHPYIQVETDDGANLRRIALDSTITIDTDDDDRTISIWFWSDYDGTGQYGNSHALLGGKYTNYWAIVGGGGNSYQMEAETNGGDDGNHDYFSRTNMGSVINKSAWNNWTVVWSSGNAQNYVNGVSVGSSLAMANNSTFTFNRIGSTSTGNGSGDRGGTWRMGGFLVYTKALTANEVTQNNKVFRQKFSRG